MTDRPRIPGTLIDNRPASGVHNSQDKTMNKAMKTVKAPLTDGFLLTDIRPRAGTFIGNFKANRKKTTKIVITLLTASVFVFSFMMTGLPMGRHNVLADSSQTRRSKMSPDLENAIVRSPDGVVRIIVD